MIETQSDVNSPQQSQQGDQSMPDHFFDAVWSRVCKGTDDPRGYTVACLEGITGVDAETLEEMCDTFNRLHILADVPRHDLARLTWANAKLGLETLGV